MADTAKGISMAHTASSDSPVAQVATLPWCPVSLSNSDTVCFSGGMDMMAACVNKLTHLVGDAVMGGALAAAANDDDDDDDDDDDEAVVVVVVVVVVLVEASATRCCNCGPNRSTSSLGIEADANRAASRRPLITAMPCVEAICSRVFTSAS